MSSPVTIALQSNNPSKMSVDQTSVTLSANEDHTYVKLNGVTIGSAELTATADGYTESSVAFSITSAPLFSCVADISNSASPTLCGCLKENDGSGLTWYRDGSQIGPWTNWCSGSGLASDPRCTAFNSSTQGNNGESLNAFNTKNHCGYTDWHLPTTTNSGAYVADLGGDWGAIGTYADNNNYIDQTNFGDWLNTNNFINIVNNSYYWDSTSYTTTKAYALLMSYGQDYFTSYDDYPIRVLVVRGSQ